MPELSCVRQTSDGVTVEVRVTPRSKPGVALSGDAVEIHVASPPVDGRATEEARKALARTLGVPPSRVTLLRGARSRTKLFQIAGASVADVTPRLADLE